MDYIDQRRALLKQNGFAVSKTSGDSMRPLIWGGDHCVVVTPLTDEPRKGDLLMFVQIAAGAERQVVHRLIEARAEGGVPTYVTRGDNCVKTETVCQSEIIGRVAEVHRISGYHPWHIIPFRKFAVTDTSYRIYACFWAAIWPLRRIFYTLRYQGRTLRAKLRLITKQ